ncbi:MAG TPA: hypothetical protein VGM70_06900 [Pseudolysinimonas sp.]|jgi:hypothetical protein
MSDTPPDATVPLPTTDDQAGEGGPADEKRRRGSLGPLPIWAWIVIAAVLVILLVVLGVALFAGGGKLSAAGSPTPTSSSASPTPSTTPTASATPTPTPTATAAPDPHVAQGTFDSDLPEFLSDTLNSQNTAVLSQAGTFTNPVWVVTAGGAGQSITPDDAVNAMTPMFTPEDPNPWDLALPDSTLAGYRAGPYGFYFPAGAIVARSSDGHVFSFIGHDESITTMFMAASEGLLQ